MPNPFAKFAPQQEETEEQANPFAVYSTKPTPQEPANDLDTQPVQQEPVSDLGLPAPPALTSTPKREEQGRVSSAGGSFMRGFGDIVASLPKAVGEGAVILANKFGDDPIWGNPEKLTPEDTASYQLGESIEKWFNKFAVNPEYADEFWTSDVASGAGSLVGFGFGGVAGKIAKVPVLATTVGLGATATGVEGVEDYLSTLSKDEKADPETRAAVFELNALIGTSEGVPVASALNVIDKFTGGGVKEVLKQGVKGGLEELIQEVFQSVMQNKTAKDWVGYDPDRGLFAGTERAGEVGFVLGYAMNTLAAIMGLRRAGKTGQPEEKAPQVPAEGEKAPLSAEDMPGEGEVVDALDISQAGKQEADEVVGVPRETETVQQQEAGGTQDLTGAVPGVGAQESVPIEEEAVSPKSAISYVDPRLNRDIYRGRLETMAGELVTGGGVSLVPDPNFIGGESDVRDEHGRPEAPMVRTESLNPEWFQSLMEDDHYSMSVGKVKNAVEKAVAGERLGVRQARVIGAMLNNVEGERTSRESMDYAREQLRIAREARSAAKMPDAGDWLLEEDQYPEDYDGVGRLFIEFQAQAEGIGKEFAENVDSLLYSNESDANIISQITKLFEAHYGQQSQKSSQALQELEGATEIQGAGAESVTGELAAGRVGTGIESGPGYAGQQPIPIEGDLGDLPTPPPPAAPTAKEEAKLAITKPVEIGKKSVEEKPKLADELTPTKDRRQKKKPGIKDEKRVDEDRRHSDKYRKSIDAMSMGERKEIIEALRHDALINRLTGLGSRMAWEEVEKKQYIASIDADSLKYVNDELGNKAGDELLIKIGKALKAEFGDDAYHVSGDEFWVHSDSLDDLTISLAATQETLVDKTVAGPGGTMTSLGFSYGIAENEDQADRDMKVDKQTRTDDGLRVERGERPDGVVLKGEKALGKKKDLAGEVDEAAQIKKDVEVTAKKEQVKKEEAAEQYAGEPDLLTGGKLEADLFAPEKKHPGKKVTPAEHITEEADRAAASPENDKKAPTKEQIKAESYVKGNPVIQGLDIAIENPVGSIRKKGWPKMAAHYGDVVGYIGADGDAVDVFVNPDVDIPDNNPVFIINQYVKGSFDEHKTMMGFTNEAEARKAYNDSYTKGWDGLNSIHELSIGKFKKWLESGDTKSEYGKVEKKAPVKKTEPKPKKPIAKKPAIKKFDKSKIPADLEIKMDVSVIETGKTETETFNAKELIDTIDNNIDSYQALKGCL